MRRASSISMKVKSALERKGSKMHTHQKEIRQLSYKIENTDLAKVASQLSSFSTEDLRLLRKAIKLERWNRKGKQFKDG